MTEFRLVFRSLDRDLLFKLILVLLLYSLVPLAEIFLFLYLADLIGNYLILAAAALTGPVGALLAVRQVPRVLSSLKARIRQGQYPGGEFVDLAGILVGCVLLLTPGFVTDLCGYLLFIPPLRARVGRALAGRLGARLRDVYEYLRLRELQAGPTV